MAEQKTYRIPRLIKLITAMVLVAGVLILSVSAIGNKEKEKVNEIQVSIQNEQEQAFITKEKVLELLSRAAGKKVKNQSVGSLDLAMIEQKLEKFDWIRNVDMYMDNQNTLRISIEQEVPVARIFTATGNSFYLSDEGSVLSMDNPVVVRVPVFTGFSANIQKMKSSDSLYLNNIGKLSKYILSNDFWMSQIDQIDMEASGKLDLVPKLGNHIIRFGYPEDTEQKFSNLLAFYKQVVMKTGWNKYSVINVQYRGQIVAERRDAAQIRSDSLASVRIMKDIIARARKNADDSTFIQLPEKHNNARIQIQSRADDAGEDVISEIIPARENPPAVRSETSSDDKKEEPVRRDEKPVVKEKPGSNKPSETPAVKKDSKPVSKEDKKQEPGNKKPAEVKKTEKRIPKAVMPVKKEN